MFPGHASAHLIGQPPFLKVNNQYSLLYTVPLSSLNDFNLPQDMAPDNYLVNQPVHMELDVTRLPAPSEVIKKTKFTWHLSDGNEASGLVVDHTYTKIGAYIIDIYADDGSTPTPQLIEKFLLNVLPDKNYQLPKAILKINGQVSKDPLTDILQTDFSKPISFDASGSTANGKIVSYFWDLGDQQTSSNPITTHSYSKELTQIFPVLRIKDQNGFISDNYVELQNQNLKLGQNAFNNLGKNIQAQSVKSQSSNTPSQIVYSLLAVGSLLLLFFGYRIVKRKRK